MGAVILVRKGQKVEYKQFDYVEHPEVPCMFYANKMRSLF